ncbi:hypothetical protein ES708_23440 [subsurface metagenome]
MGISSDIFLVASIAARASFKSIMVSIIIKSTFLPISISACFENAFTASSYFKEPTGSSSFPKGPISPAINMGFSSPDLDLYMLTASFAAFTAFSFIFLVSFSSLKDLSLMGVEPKVLVWIISEPASR